MTDTSRKPLQRRLGGIAGHVPPEQSVIFAGIRTIDDPKQRKPDIRLAKRNLDWEPKVSLEDGLKETIAYFRRTLDLT